MPSLVSELFSRIDSSIAERFDALITDALVEDTPHNPLPHSEATIANVKAEVDDSLGAWLGEKGTTTTAATGCQDNQLHEDPEDISDVSSELSESSEDDEGTTKGGKGVDTGKIGLTCDVDLDTVIIPESDDEPTVNTHGVGKDDLTSRRHGSNQRGHNIEKPTPDKVASHKPTTHCSRRKDAKVRGDDSHCEICALACDLCGPLSLSRRVNYNTEDAFLFNAMNDGALVTYPYHDGDDLSFVRHMDFICTLLGTHTEYAAISEDMDEDDKMSTEVGVVDITSSKNMFPSEDSVREVSDHDDGIVSDEDRSSPYAEHVHRAMSSTLQPSIADRLLIDKASVDCTGDNHYPEALVAVWFEGLGSGVTVEADRDKKATTPPQTFIHQRIEGVKNRFLHHYPQHCNHRGIRCTHRTSQGQQSSSTSTHPTTTLPSSLAPASPIVLFSGSPSATTTRSSTNTLDTKRFLSGLSSLVDELSLIRKHICPHFPSSLPLYQFYLSRYHSQLLSALLLHLPILKLSSPALLRAANWLQTYSHNLDDLRLPATLAPPSPLSSSSSSSSSSAMVLHSSSNRISLPSVSPTLQDVDWSSSRHAPSLGRVVVGALMELPSISSRVAVSGEIAVFIDSLMDQYISNNRGKIMGWIDNIIAQDCVRSSALF